VNGGNKNAGGSLMSTCWFIHLQPHLAYVKQPQTFVDREVHPPAFVCTEKKDN
jgi:hypothetical protein